MKVLMRGAFVCVTLALGASAGQGAEDAIPTDVSFHRQIRPIFQAHCQGCHQPAKRGGEYLMTAHAELLKPGESGAPAIVAGDPHESHLLAVILPVEGKAEMPKGKPPLTQIEIDLIHRWIEQGAKDDTPESAQAKVDVAHPPVYTRPPLITSLDYSPDGALLAIAGFHEAIIRSADGEELVARLVGLSERIEAVAFSPDGKRLAVAGGQPGRMGELQIWDVALRELSLSIPVTFDTLYGASWSPDGKLVAVGCSDSTVRAFDASSGSQVFFNSAHDDWSLDTVFSTDGSMLVSVGRDMSTKLYNVGEQRFIDNVTSITPGALRGGISAIARRPDRNEVLVGGSDGIPRIYRLERVTKRVIGDDANLIRKFPEMKGRIYAVTYAPDGKSIACGSSLDGQGGVTTYFSDVDSEMPKDIRRIVQKVVAGQKDEEKARLEEYVRSDVKVLTETPINGGVYALAYKPDGKTIAAAGTDGVIRLIDPANGKIVKEFLPAPVNKPEEAPAASRALASRESGALPTEVEGLPAGTRVVSMQVSPETIHLNSRFDYAQLLATGTLDTGEPIDLTRNVTWGVEGKAAVISNAGRVSAVADGEARVFAQLGELKTESLARVAGAEAHAPMNFIRDVNPVLTRLGCNSGSCHGSKEGKNGFKLSLRGYDPIFDVRAFSDDIKSRRTNVASPDDSLMLLKASGVVPHAGGQLTRPGEAYYEIIRGWISEGARLDENVERVASITIEPINPVIQTLGSKRQLRVVATYSNGAKRDVTAEAFLESGATDVAEISPAKIVTAVRRGEAPLLARFEGNYAATTLTAMGNREGFEWKDPETWSEIDKLIAAKWKTMKIAPSDLCDDAEFLRRAYLDLTGLPPTADAVLEFTSDKRPTREKRDAVIERLVGSDAYVEFWTNKWADLLQVNSKFLGKDGAAAFRGWIRLNISDNAPYDQFCREVLTARGSNKEHPAASYFKILREPDMMLENSTHLFLGVRFNCNKCHDHPFERWTQNQYYETAAYFAQVGLQRDPKNAEGDIGGTDVEKPKPLWEVVFDKSEGEVKHERTGAVTAPLVPYDRDIKTTPDSPRRDQLADWITSPENDYFAKSYVNRVWGYLLGVGLIEPLDDIRAGNPPSNPELLDYLTKEFVESKFNVRQLMRTICKSRAYQLSIATNKWNEDDRINYSHATPKRLPAEVLYDAVYTVTGSKMQIPGVPEGTRAAALPDVAIGLEDGFLDNLGRPVRQSACECERSSGLQLGPVMALMNGPTVNQAISQPGNAIEKIAANEPDNAKMIDKIFLRVLNRPAKEEEVKATVALMEDLGKDHEQLVAEFKTYEESVRGDIEKQQAAWKVALEKAEAEFKTYDEENRDRIAAEKKAWEVARDAAKKAVDEYVASAPERLKEWEKTAADSHTKWRAIDFSEVKTTNEANLKKQSDRSVIASGSQEAEAEYICTGPVRLKTITAVRLEVLADNALPKKGPGRAKDGNFILTEFTADFLPAGKEDDKIALGLRKAKADYEQKGYEVAGAIDGEVPIAFNGWSIDPEVGHDHVATFELASPLAVAKGSLLRFGLDHRYVGGMHTIGRFRISVTDAAGQIDFGLTDEIERIIAKSSEDRTKEEAAALLEFYTGRDTDLRAKREAFAKAKRPLPEDAKLVQLRKAVEEHKKPLPEDPKLARLRRSVELSEGQLKDRRITTAQDLAWALINSPAFLFNR